MVGVPCKRVIAGENSPRLAGMGRSPKLANCRL